MVLTYNRQKHLTLMVLAALLLSILLILIRFIYPVGVDWQYTFARIPAHIPNPYAIHSFKNPPWIMFLLPHAWLPLAWGNAVNLVLNIVMILLVIRRFGGDWRTMLLVFTSPLMLDLARTNNIDWIPLLAFLIPAKYGLPLLALKPQTLGGAALIWLKRARFRWTILVPSLVIFIGSLVLWGLWFVKPSMPNQVTWNFSVFPFGIPLGIYLLYRAFQADDEILAAAATPFLMPYFAPYSLAPLLALVGCKYRREALIVYAAFWCYVIVEMRRIGLH
jgi:hypothetical protein